MESIMNHMESMINNPESLMNHMKYVPPFQNQMETCEVSKPVLRFPSFSWNCIDGIDFLLGPKCGGFPYLKIRRALAQLA